MQARHRHRDRRSRPQQADGKGKSVGLLFDVTGRGDKSFNDGAAAGARQGQDRLRHHRRRVDADRPGRQRPPRAHQGASSASNDLDRGRRLPVGRRHHGVGRRRTRTRSTPSSTRSSYTLGADGKPTTTVAPNVRSMVFAANEGSALVGAAAACASKTGKIGFIGGVQTDLIKKLRGRLRRRRQGREPRHRRSRSSTSPSRPTSPASTTRPRARPSPSQMYDSGVDVIYAAAGGSGKGLFTAAVESGKKPGELYAIGVDSDQYLVGLRRREAVHPHLDAEAGRRGHLRGHRRPAQRQAQGRGHDLRPQEQRHRLLGLATRTSSSTPAPSRS